MTTNENLNEIIVDEIEEETITGDFSDLLSVLNEGETEEEKRAAVEVSKATKLEVALSTVDKEKEMAVSSPSDAHFRFRELLSEKQRSELQLSAPKIAERFVADVNQIMNFGSGTLNKMKMTSKQMLEAQKQVEIPEADMVVNDLLRELDGFDKKYKNVKMEDFGKKFLGIFKSAKYSMTTLTREMKPVEEKLDMAEIKLEEMDFQLAENITRGQTLHKQTLNQMNEVVIVLASLEEIIENIRRDYRELDNLLLEANSKGLDHVEYKGKTTSVKALDEIREQYSLALSETEKTWSDWRQQFFLGWANAPAIRNLTASTFALRRRLKTFKDMGIQAGRQALVTRKQAVEARMGAEMGNNVQKANNLLIQQTYKELGDTTKLIAEASQAPIITEETINVMISSVRDQARHVVVADRQGRALRAKNLAALERGEVQIRDEVLAMHNQLAENARQDHSLEGKSSSSNPALSSSAETGDDLLNTLSNE